MTRRTKNDKTTSISKTANLYSAKREIEPTRLTLNDIEVKAFSDHYTALGFAITITIAAFWGWQQPAPDSFAMKIPYYAGLFALNGLGAYVICSNEVNFALKVKTKEIPRLVWQAHILGLAAIVSFLTQQATK